MPKTSAGLLPYRIGTDESIEVLIVHPGGPFWKNKDQHVWAIEATDLSTESVVSNEFEMEWPPRSGLLCSFPEIDRAEWTGIPEARDRLVKGQVELLDRLLRLQNPDHD